MSEFFMHDLARLNGWNRQLRLPARPQPTIFELRSRESARNQRALLNQAATTNLLSLPTHVLALSKVLGLPIWANPMWRPAAAELPKLVLLPQQGHA